MTFIESNPEEALETELREGLRAAQEEWEKADASSKEEKKNAWVEALRAFSAFVAR
jgi:hypothetical protein